MRTKVRLAHLQQLSAISSPSSAEFERWSKTRLDRLIVDYMLRQGYLQTAIQAADETGVRDFVDVELFVARGGIERALAGGSATECLGWCGENKSSLKKIKSTLEFNLRIQEFVEIIRQSRIPDAIIYAKKYLASFAGAHLKQIQQAMALLAFTSTTSCKVYSKYFAADRWTALIAQFRSDHNSLNSLPSEPSLKISLQAGLSALKTPHCYNETDKNINCPVCESETFGKLAEGLPMSHHVNSCIVCRINGGLVNESDGAMVMPNGFVYSFSAMTEMSERCGGRVTCPRSGNVYSFGQLRKAFIS